MRIAIVNDMTLAQEALRRVVMSNPQLQVAWLAKNGAEAIQKCEANRPDLILMDLIMPDVDGVEATRQIMKKTPCPILVVTSTITGNFEKVYEALGHGALDAVNTPVLGRDGKASGAEDLLLKISRVIARNRPIASSPIVAPTIATPKPMFRSDPHSLPTLVLLGSSTGGPQALKVILTGLAGRLGNASLIIIQHIGGEYAPGLAGWLSEETKFPVEPAKAGDFPRAGKALLAVTDDHLVMTANHSLAYTNNPTDNPYRPSIDVFYDSLARYWPNPGVAVVLTGMGRDGAQGLKLLRDAGWSTIAQDQTTSVVYGMPMAAANLGAAQRVLPLPAISSAIQMELEKLSRTSRS